MNDHPETSRAKVMALLPDDLSPSVIFAKYKPTFIEIIDAVCGHYNVPTATLTSGDDTATKRCRSLVSYLCRDIARSEIKDIALLVMRHPNNVNNQLLKMPGRLAADELLRDDVDIIKRKIASAILQRDRHVADT